MRWPSYAVVLSITQWATADIHHLFASSYRSPHLFALEYDTTKNTLNQVGNFSAHAGHPWLSWGLDRATLYGAERDGWASYQVASPTELIFQSNLTLRGRCDGGNFKHGTTSVIAQVRSPYNVFGAGRSPCGNVMASRVDGSLERIVQNITYQPSSRVHGMALDPDNAYLYSADVSANGIWAHKIDQTKGTLTNARFKSHSEENSRPRRLALHPSGRYLYVLLSKLNKVVVYDTRMQNGGPQLTNTGMSYSILPPGVNSSMYRGHDLAFSANSDILYISARYQVARREKDEEEEGAEETEEEGEEEDEKVSALNDDQNRFSQNDSKSKKKFSRQLPWMLFGYGNANKPKTPGPAPAKPAVVLQPGYLTAILLTNPEQPKNSDVGAGYPIQIIVQVATSTSGGKSNSITPANWANDHLALTDSEKGLVQVWRLDGLEALPRELQQSRPAPAPPTERIPTQSPAPANQQRTTATTQSYQPIQTDDYKSLPPPSFSAPPLFEYPPSPPPEAPVPQIFEYPAPVVAPAAAQPPIAIQPSPVAARPPKSEAPRPPAWSTPGSRGWGRLLQENARRQLVEAGSRGAPPPYVYVNVRANIVAEWRAPLNTVGEGDPAAPREKSRENDDQKYKVPKWGRGCCANAVWFD